jgi:hypothetical protein
MARYQRLTMLRIFFHMDGSVESQSAESLDRQQQQRFCQERCNIATSVLIQRKAVTTLTWPGSVKQGGWMITASTKTKTSKK